MNEKPFYAGGLRFSCTRCSSCCRYESGFVFLSRKDAELLAEELKMEYTAFVETFCRWVPAPDPVSGGALRLSLKEKTNFDCVFWDGGCKVYERRPLQCRSFPFWDSIIYSETVWKGLDCPGKDRGTFHGPDEIETYLGKRREEPIMEREA
ncbi:MAG: YkgJ family cysteine cluster protein [Treponema sp.]|jgi:Fe-S-cluster containining protein|nr:YkgJ family cysteine cluster protein [Treponema sp.]